MGKKTIMRLSMDYSKETYKKVEDLLKLSKCKDFSTLHQRLYSIGEFVFKAIADGNTIKVVDKNGKETEVHFE